MGALRLFLAISVVISHTGPVFGMNFMPGTEAVRVFFIISGFYMALVLSGRYSGRPLLFYSNRLLRLYPMFLVALVLATVIQLCVLRSTFLTNLLAWHWNAAQFLAVIPNLTMLGGDVMFLLHQGVQDLHFTFGAYVPASDPTAMRTGIYLMNPPAWSIGLELWFYLLAPAIMRLRMRYVVALALASYGIEVWVEHLHPYASYFFFPANLGFFLLGVMGYRFSTTELFRWVNDLTLAGRLRLGTLGALGAITMLVGREFIPYFRNYPWQHYTVAAIAIPFVFERFKSMKWDRWIGELSYPLYILHASAITLAAALFGKASAGSVLLLVAPVAIAGTLWIEAPLDRWRAARAGRRAVPTSTAGDAAPALAAE